MSKDDGQTTSKPQEETKKVNKLKAGSKEFDNSQFTAGVTAREKATEPAPSNTKEYNKSKTKDDFDLNKGEKVSTVEGLTPEKKSFWDKVKGAVKAVGTA